MEMNNFGLPRKVSAQMGDRFGEEHKPLGIVWIILTVLSIEPGPIIKLGDIYEIHRQVLRWGEGPDPGRHTIPAQRQVHLPIERHQLRKPLPDAPIEGGDDSHLMVFVGQRLAQGSHHVSQPATLGVRK